MTTTIGQLVSDLFEHYERSYGDEKLAALATQARIVAMLRRSELKRRTAAPAPTRRLRAAR